MINRRVFRLSAEISRKAAWDFFDGIGQQQRSRAG
jgi:hypothetical protein